MMSRQARVEPRVPMIDCSDTNAIGVAAAWVEQYYNAARVGFFARCVLLSNQIDQRPDELRRLAISLTTRLPHDALTAFCSAGLAGLPAEPAESVEVRRQSTQAEDLGRATGDGDGRLQ